MLIIKNFLCLYDFYSHFYLYLRRFIDFVVPYVFFTMGSVRITSLTLLRFFRESQLSLLKLSSVLFRF